MTKVTIEESINVSFESVPVGTFFREGIGTYIKINSFTDEDGDNWNALGISEGHLYKIWDNAKVVPVKEVIIKI